MNRSMKHAPKISLTVLAAAILALSQGCVAPKTGPLPSAKPPLPESFPGVEGTTNTAVLGWRGGFSNWRMEVFAGGPVSQPTGFNAPDRTAGFSITSFF